MLTHIFDLCKALTFAILFCKRSHIYLVFALCTVAVIYILFQLCNAGAEIHKLHSSGSFARLHQWRTLAAEEEWEGGTPSGLFSPIFFFLRWLCLWRWLCPFHYPSSLSNILLHCPGSLGGSQSPGGALLQESRLCHLLQLLTCASAPPPSLF